MERTLELGKYESSQELVRWLTSIEPIHHPLYQSFRDLQGSSKSNLPISMDHNLFHLEIIIAAHAQRLLLKGHLRDLLNLSKSLSFPLVGWLKRQR